MKNYWKAVGIAAGIMGALVLFGALVIATRCLIMIPAVIFGTAVLIKEDLDSNDRRTR